MVGRRPSVVNTGRDDRLRRHVDSKRFLIGSARGQSETAACKRTVLVPRLWRLANVTRTHFPFSRSGLTSSPVFRVI